MPSSFVSVDEALIALAEAIMLAGLLSLSMALWSSSGSLYCEAVAKAINASARDAETLLVLPKPVSVKPGFVCYSGVCFRIAAKEVRGGAWLCIAVDRGKVKGCTNVFGGAQP